MYPLPELRTERACIRLPKESDAARVLRYRIDNREHFAPWEPQREEAYFTEEACRRFIANGLEAARADRAYPFLVLDADQNEVLASITLTNVVRGIFQASHIGYGVAGAWQGKGLMHETLRAVLNMAFGTLGLHRVMANHLPDNQRSARVLERLGFEREGYARAYLCIDGRWQDHVLTAKINPRDQPSSPAA